jgi:hypothetical protein
VTLQRDCRLQDCRVHAFYCLRFLYMPCPLISKRCSSTQALYGMLRHTVLTSVHASLVDICTESTKPTRDDSAIWTIHLEDPPFLRTHYARERVVYAPISFIKQRPSFQIGPDPIHLFVLYVYVYKSPTLLLFHTLFTYPESKHQRISLIQKR